MIPKGVAAKLEFFRQHKDEFDTLIVGTSRLYYSVAPEILDRTTSEQGLPTNTFNFGIDAMHPPESFYVLEKILETKPRKLKWVLLEMGDIQTRWDASLLGTQRGVYWHDWRRTALTLKKALDPRGGAPWYIRATRLWLARRDFASNLVLFGRQFANIGRAADFVPGAARERMVDAALELGPRRDGHRRAGEAMSAERAAIFQQKLAEELARAHSKNLDPTSEAGYREAAATIRKYGARPIFVATPVTSQSWLRFARSPSPGPVLTFNDFKKYPSLYDTKVRIDDGHLTDAGAQEFTRLLAEEFVRQMREP